ncbi:MAG: restriction endonuclease, partial [Alphaproteobacteria bacterium]|nr:restriction endonuclease [Alphaproteobacteria bacterium]
MNDWIIYYEPTKIKHTKGYFAAAKVQQIIQDPHHDDMFLAIIEPGTYLDFGDSVGFRVNGEVAERELLNEYGKPSANKRSAIRILSPEDFNRII